jgi:hypothetical protein
MARLLLLGLLCAALQCALAAPTCWSALSKIGGKFEVASRSCTKTGFDSNEVVWLSWDDAIEQTGWFVLALQFFLLLYFSSANSLSYSFALAFVCIV